MDGFDDVFDNVEELMMAEMMRAEYDPPVFDDSPPPEPEIVRHTGGRKNARRQQGVLNDQQGKFARIDVVDVLAHLVQAAFGDPQNGHAALAEVGYPGIDVS